MIAHHSPGLLRLAGLEDLRTARPAHARLTMPQAIPDGLLDVTFTDQKEPCPVLVEIETYPDATTADQLINDMDLARMALGVLPETILIVLCPRGQQKQASWCRRRSLRGFSRTRHEWKVVELWKVPAERLLSLSEPGLIPLLVLTKTDQTLETVVEQCRERIERQAKASERATLVTITAIMASLRSGHVEHWLALMGGRKVVEHSPLYQHWMAESARTHRQEAIASVLATRFGLLPEELGAMIRSVTELDRLKEGIVHAAACKSLKDFQKRFTTKP
jgi:hypothetical protein